MESSKRRRARLTLLIPMELKDRFEHYDFEDICEILKDMAEQELEIASCPVDIEVIISFGWFTPKKEGSS